MEQMYNHYLLEQYNALLPLVRRVAELIADYCSKHSEANIVFDIDDTLIFDDERQTPNVQVKHLLDVARAYGCKVHLVTARQKSTEVRRWTENELRKLDIRYDSLALAPQSARESMKLVSKWKREQREKHKPVVASIGDQWGDSICIESDEDIDLLNKLFRAEHGPWMIIRPNDGITEYGIKLMAPA